MLNKHQIIGYVGSEPEFMTTEQGNFRATLRVATTERSFTTSRGQLVPERTTWHNVEMWGGMAKLIQQFVHKGSKLYVEGIHHTRDYEKDGQNFVWHTIDATAVELLDKKEDA